MKHNPEHVSVASASELRAILRADLVAAMKARRPDAVNALRTAIAAIDNAEAVVVAKPRPADAGEHVAGAQAGVGSSEADRHQLSTEAVHGLLRSQIKDRTTEADRYDAHGLRDAADQLRREAELLGKYTGP